MPKRLESRAAWAGVVFWDVEATRNIRGGRVKGRSLAVSLRSIALRARLARSRSGPFLWRANLPGLKEMVERGPIDAGYLGNRGFGDLEGEQVLDFLLPAIQL